MWPGQQPPGGGHNQQNPQDQNANPYQQPGYQQPNPYQQPGYQAPNPYQQPGAGPQGQWGAPTVPVASGGRGGGGGGNRVKVLSIVAALAVVVAAGVTGFLVLGGDGDGEDRAGGSPSKGASQAPATADDGDDGGRDADNGLKPTIKGWHVVVNPRWGTAFDVPPEWEVQNPDTALTYSDDKTGEPLMTMSGPAYLKPKWCTADDDKDGRNEDHELAAVGTKGAKGAKNTDEIALIQSESWVYAAYTQPDKKSYTVDEKAQPFTTKSGIKGSYAWARSKGTPMSGKCATDGKAITFGFKNSEGTYVSWSLYGSSGVKDEVSEDTVMKILSTVRTHGEPTKS
ncbi:hypothetical protein DCW30_14165 [Streptomyces alfalfae]|uniref:DUF8017 domain-containing protein n=1 Tax=Streptomyces alfalfae TaxID=1642299 RepID=A0ABM6H005_9ACTN|nr:hypothetical protein [Streptomyces alfalfae]APY89427.1 hypothetical protein A7J05_30390 [Streptomyces alfalfae]AYA19859.1 hypothetical protein D3X13_29655 [Streptomyces fradiae]RXX44003.1 hypothetical protein DCW30_14165 [Streptomyces alfalfae]RZN04129.1 hypothetical protein D4104_03455 [Streptomyces alfalfae]